MAAKVEILLVSESLEVRDAVFHALDSDSGFAMGSICRNLEDLAAFMERDPKEVVLVDIDPDPRGTLARLEHIARKLPHTRFVVLAEELQNELVLEAMQAGVRHFLVKNSIAAQLIVALKRLLPNGSTPSLPPGRVITVLSGSGGCGATTLAINLANELGLLVEEPTLLVDLDTSYGAVATCLGLRGRFGVADVLARKGEIDAQLIRTTTQAYSEHLHVLASPAAIDLDSASHLRYDRLKETIQASKHAYKYVVVDAPRLPIGAAAEVVKSSDMTYMVFQLTVKDIAAVRRFLAALADQGVAMDNITLLASRYRKRHSMITIKEAQEALDGRTIRCLGNDYHSAVACVNYGRVLADYSPRATLRRELKELAQTVFSTYFRQIRVKPSAGRQS